MSQQSTAELINNTESTPFLETVARDILRRHNDDLSTCLLLFPTYRSLLYFRKALVKVAGRPVWTPQMHTLDSYIMQLTGWQSVEDLNQCILLYKFWRQVGGNEAFEDFYGLGLMLLKDFDALDRALVDTDLFFDQLKAVAELETWDQAGMTEELKLLARSMQSSALGDNLGKIWRVLGDLYGAFRSALKEGQMGSSAVAARHLIEMDFDGVTDIEYNAAYVIGMYQLSQAEEAILKHIDADQYYWAMPPNDHIKLLDCEHPSHRFISDQKDISKVISPIADEDKSITISPVSGDMAQFQLLSNALKGLTEEELDKTGIILPDQAMLLPLLNVIPEEVKHINVSMGLSSLDTPVFVLLSRFIDCLDSWDQHYNTYIEVKKLKMFFSQSMISTLPHVNTILGHIDSTEGRFWKIDDQWLQMDSDWRDLLSPSNGQVNLLSRCLHLLELVYEKESSELNNASIYHLHQSLLSLKVVMDQQESEWSPSFFGQFLKRILQHTRITLKGEPLKGLQVLGLFEMANLQFDRLFVLQCNEGTLPTLSHNTIFPHSLAQRYGLPGFSDKADVQDFLFWNLVSSTSEVTMYYNVVSNTGMGTEPSRWIQRLMQGIRPETWSMHEVSMAFASKSSAAKPIQFTVNDAERSQIRDWLENGEISPTAIDTWLTCRLRWYLQYILKFRNYEDDSEEMDSGQLGNIVHKVLEEFYAEYKGQVINKYVIGQFEESLERLSTDVYVREMRLPYDLANTGKHKLFITAVIGNLKRLLRYDEANVPFIVKDTEDKIKVVVSHRGLELTFKGIIDRVDEMPSGAMRLVDFKTGKESKNISGKLTMDDLWTRDEQKAKEVRQTLLYTYFYHEQHKQLGLPEPHLYFSRANAGTVDSKVSLKDGDIDLEMIKAFEQHLFDEIDNMLSEELIIDQTTKEDHCKFCDFKSMCGRD